MSTETDWLWVSWKSALWRHTLLTSVMEFPYALTHLPNLSEIRCKIVSWKPQHVLHPSSQQTLRQYCTVVATSRNRCVVFCRFVSWHAGRRGISVGSVEKKVTRNSRVKAPFTSLSASFGVCLLHCMAQMHKKHVTFGLSFPASSTRRSLLEARGILPVHCKGM